jgi:hypothetical protein
VRNRLANNRDRSQLLFESIQPAQAVFPHHPRITVVGVVAALAGRVTQILRMTARVLVEKNTRADENWQT